jgi:hypothetical protein
LKEAGPGIKEPEGVKKFCAVTEELKKQVLKNLV